MEILGVWLKLRKLGAAKTASFWLQALSLILVTSLAFALGIGALNKRKSPTSSPTTGHFSTAYMAEFGTVYRAVGAGHNKVLKAIAACSLTYVFDVTDRSSGEGRREGVLFDSEIHDCVRLLDPQAFCWESKTASDLLCKEAGSSETYSTRRVSEIVANTFYRTY